MAVDTARDALNRLPHHQGGNSGCEIHHLDATPHLTASVGEQLAVFSTDQLRQLIGVLFEQALVAEHQLGALRNRCVPPGWKGRGRGCHRVVNLPGRR
jgi:hypothetical protein